MYDPVLILRTRAPVLPSKIDGLFVSVPVSLGAGLGDSDLVYEVEVQLQYAFNATVDARLGYRAVGYDFESDKNNKLDSVQAGWTMGVGFRF